MSHIHWVERQNKLEIPNDEEEVNTWEIHESDGEAHDRETKLIDEGVIFGFYYESMKRKLWKPIYECRRNERLQTWVKKFMRLGHTCAFLLWINEVKDKTYKTYIWVSV
jgi:hypothetical protein